MLTAVVVACAFALVVVAFVRRRRRKTVDAAASARKAAFLKAAGGAYGYAGSAAGYIDAWRSAELPTLIAPLGAQGDGAEVYLDYAGAALPVASQDAAAAARARGALGNPHAAGGPAAARSAALGDAARRAVLRHLGAGADYDVVWTAGATAALKLVAELFPWAPGSTFAYDADAHTSVVGVRYVAEAAGATVAVGTSAGGAGSLVIVSAESNFDGAARPGAADAVRAARATGATTLVDASKAAASGPVDVAALGSPDLLVLSLYKLFGAPTGLGCLVGTRAALRALRDAKATRGFVGGGTLERVSAASGYRALKTRPADALEDGTPHFRAFPAVLAGFEALDRVGGMAHVRRHASCLGAWLRAGLRGLRHASGAPAAAVYGRETDSTVAAFNVLDGAGNCVSPAEVAKVAAAAGVQLRHGCFCNPGACAAALGLSERDVRDAADRGRACGGDDDLDDGGRPLGALRASLGKDSLFEDVDALLEFLRTFVRESVSTEAPAPPAKSPFEPVVVSDVFVYPLKSCRGFRVDGWPVLADGRLAHDRDFALVGPDGAPLSPATTPRLALLDATIDLDARALVVTRSDTGASVRVGLDGGGAATRSDVRVCGSSCGAVDCGFGAADAWCSEALATPCALARRGDGGFANEAPLLLVSREALAALDGRLPGSADAARFRPNVVVEGGPAHGEDAWAAVEVGGCRFEVTGPCGRCATIELDPGTGLRDRGARTLRTLAAYRKAKGKVCFGVFLRRDGAGGAARLRVGDAATPSPAAARGETALAIYEPPKLLNVQRPSRVYELPRTGSVTVTQRWGTGGTGAAQWPAGVALARLIDGEGLAWRGLRVLETGAGGGALVAVAALRAGATYVATDADEAVFDQLEANVRRNVADASRFRGAAVLRWGDDVAPAVAALGGPPDVVLAADVAYAGSRPHWPALFDTLKSLGARRTLLAHTTRYAKDDALFFRGLRAAGLTAAALDLAHLPDVGRAAIFDVSLPPVQ